MYGSLARRFIPSLLITLISIVAQPALADLRGMLQQSYVAQLQATRSTLASIRRSNCTSCTPNVSASCQSFYGRMENDGVIDVRVAFGYMDVSQGEPYVYAGRDLGQSPTLDSGASPAFAEVLTSRCWRTGAETCGFSRRRDDPELLEKSITRADGRRILVRVRVTRASASLYHPENVGPLWSEQQRLTETSERNFFGGLQEADAVLYLGHARNGGGPDFTPVVLRDDRNPNTLDKPNYAGHYLTRRPGMNRMVESIKSGGRSPALLALYACSSDRHFTRALRSASPETALIVTGDLINYDEILNGALGTVEALLRGSCSDEFRSQLQLTPFSRQEVLLKQFPGSVGP